LSSPPGTRRCVVGNGGQITVEQVGVFHGEFLDTVLHIGEFADVVDGQPGFVSQTLIV
jgi:hypothetical protein